MSAKVTVPSPAEWQHELDLFQAFCDRCGRNPLEWSVQTRRLYRKQVQRCRKHDRATAYLCPCGCGRTPGQHSPMATSELRSAA